MIAINLLPHQLRKAQKKMALPTNFPYKVYLLGLAVFLIFLHILFLSLALVKNIHIMGLKGSWSRMEPQSRESAAIRKNIKDMESQAGLIKEALTRKASMTELLSSLSAAVPKGLWLESFTYSDEGLVIQGSVVSQQQNEMTIIGKFLQEIRGNKIFATFFSKVELNSVQRRTIKTYDVVDFILIGEFKK
jgi:Tfp pilus assembly protein PilN